MLWTLLVIPALVVLRLLLPRRLRVMTAVLGLWRAAAEKLATRGRTHPARSDVLLAVLLLAAALLILAGAGLQWSDVREEPVAITILLDGSPSMSAREDDGQTRLQIANDIVRDVNEAFTRLLGQPFQLPRQQMPKDQPSDAPLSRRMIENRAAELATDGSVLLITDQPANAPGNVHVLQVGSPRENIAIAAFATGNDEVFVRLAQYGGDGSRTVQVTIFGGKGNESAVRTAARTITINKTATAVFPFDLAGLDWLACRISPPEGQGPLDALAWDDIAWLSRRWTNRIRVRLIGEPSKWLRRAMADDPRVAWTEQTEVVASDATAVDLLIANKTPPTGTAPWILQITGGEQTVPTEGRLVVSDPDSALMRNVNLSGVRIAKRSEPAAVGEATVLATLDDTPAITLRSLGGRRIVEIGFSLEQTNSNWVTQRSFPVFLSRLIELVRKDRPVAFADEFGALPVDSPSSPAVALLTDPTRPAEMKPLLSSRRLRRIGCRFLVVGGRTLPLATWSTDAEESDLSKVRPTAFDAAEYVASLPKQRKGTVTPLWPYLLAAALIAVGIAWGWLRR